MGTDGGLCIELQLMENKGEITALSSRDGRRVIITPCCFMDKTSELNGKLYFRQHEDPSEGFVQL